MSNRVHRVVLDTNVLFEGMTRQGGACGLVIDAWSGNLMQVCVSNALAYEYADVLSRKLSPPKWQKAQIALRTLLHQAEFVSVYYSWRPASPDPGDDLVVDCAMNANAYLITSNTRDFKLAQTELGLQVLTPLELLALLMD